MLCVFITIMLSDKLLSDQYFYVALLVLLYKLVLPFKTVDQMLVCDHSVESYMY